MAYKVYIVLFLISITSCVEQTKNVPLEYFNSKYEIRHKNLNVGSEKILSFGNMILYENENYLLKEEYRGDALVSKIYYTRDSVIPFLKKGNGPNEYIWLKFLHKDSVCNDFEALDLSRRCIYRITEEGERIESFPLQNSVFGAIKLDSKYIISGCFENMDENDQVRFVEVDLSGKLLKTFGVFPEEKNRLPNHIKLFAYQGKMISHPSCSRFVFLSAFGAIFEIYEITEEEVKTVVSYNDKLPLYESNESGNVSGVKYKPENILGYVDAYATSKFIFTLFSGKQMSSRRTGGAEEIMATQHILVYDWDGNYVCRLETDVPLTNLCVSSDNKSVIGISLQDDFGLCMFDISNIPELIN